MYLLTLPGWGIETLFDMVHCIIESRPFQLETPVAIRYLQSEDYAVNQLIALQINN